MTPVTPILLIVLGMTRCTFGSLDITDVCPSTSFCSSNSQRNRTILHHQPFCCVPCSCHSNCDLVGMCCHDADKENPIIPVYPCKTQKEIYRKYLSTLDPPPSNLKVRIVTDCHGNLNNVPNETVSHCMAAFHLEDLKFATGKTSGITYLNKHCALCNGEELDDVTVWDLYVETSDTDTVFSNYGSFEARDEYLLRKGSVVAVPTTDWATMVTYCPRIAIKSCNIFGTMDFVDDVLEEKCKRYNSIYYNEQGRKFYRNPFCYLCNEPTGVNLDAEECPNLAHVLYNANKLMHSRFTALISSNRTTSNIKGTTSRLCNSGETMDFFLAKCTKLLCPPGTMVVGDTCNPLFENDTGIIMGVLFSVLFEGPIKPADYKPVLTDLRSTFMSLVNQYGTQCAFCAANLYLEEEQYSFEMSFISSENCSYLQLLKNFAMISKTKPITIFSNTIQSNITMFVNSSTTQMLRSNVKASYATRSICNGVRFSEEMIPCPSIIINISDINAMAVDINTKTEILGLGIHVDNGTSRICLEEYNKIHVVVLSSSAFIMLYSHTLCMSAYILRVIFLLL